MFMHDMHEHVAPPFYMHVQIKDDLHNHHFLKDTVAIIIFQ